VFIHPVKEGAIYQHIYRRVFELGSFVTRKKERRKGKKRKNKATEGY